MKLSFSSEHFDNGILFGAGDVHYSALPPNLKNTMTVAIEAIKNGHIQFNELSHQLKTDEYFIQTLLLSLTVAETDVFQQIPHHVICSSLYVAHAAVVGNHCNLDDLPETVTTDEHFIELLVQYGMEYFLLLPEETRNNLHYVKLIPEFNNCKETCEILDSPYWTHSEMKDIMFQITERGTKTVVTYVFHHITMFEHEYDDHFWHDHDLAKAFLEANPELYREMHTFNKWFGHSLDEKLVYVAMESAENRDFFLHKALQFDDIICSTYFDKKINQAISKCASDDHQPTFELYQNFLETVYAMKGAIQYYKEHNS